MTRPVRNRILMTMALLLGTGIVAGALLWSNRPRTDDVPPRVLESARRASEYFDALPAIPVTASAAIVDSLANAGPVPGQPSSVEASTEREEKLLRRISEWLRLRHEGDPDAYAEWARSQGYHLTLTRDDVEERARFYSMSRDGRERFYQFHTGEPLPSDLSPLDYFRFCFRTSLEMNNSLLRPAAIAAGEKGAHVLFQRVRAADHLILERWAGVEHWHSGWTAGCAVHWSPPVLLEELLAQDGSALCAIVAVAIESTEGEWVPTIITAYWVPSRGDWCLFQATYSNTPSYTSRFEI